MEDKKKKGFLSGIMDRFDKKLEEKASCGCGCCCGEKKKKKGDEKGCC